MDIVAVEFVELEQLVGLQHHVDVDSVSLKSNPGTMYLIFAIFFVLFIEVIIVKGYTNMSYDSLGCLSGSPKAIFRSKTY